ncbi:MAG: hypothetical protein GQ574_05230 [Crocinitomix sp.]|nr:hypothetical protein [Crocinitomix sp.]
MKKKRIWIGITVFTALIFLAYFIFIQREVTILIEVEDSEYDSLRVELKLDDALVFDEYVQCGFVGKMFKVSTTFGRHEFSLKTYGREISLDTSSFIMLNDNFRITAFSNSIYGDGFSFVNIGLEEYYFD